MYRENERLELELNNNNLKIIDDLISYGNFTIKELNRIFGEIFNLDNILNTNNEFNSLAKFGIACYKTSYVHNKEIYENCLLVFRYNINIENNNLNNDLIKCPITDIHYDIYDLDSLYDKKTIAELKKHIKLANKIDKKIQANIKDNMTLDELKSILSNYKFNLQLLI